MFAVVTSIRLEVGSRRLSQLEADERFREHLSFVGNNTLYLNFAHSVGGTLALRKLAICCF